MMRFGRVPTRSRWFRVWVGLAAAGLLAATTLWALPGPGTGPSSSSGPSSSAVPSAAASAVASSTPAASESPGADAWQPVALEPYVPLADLVATRSDTAGVEPATAFRLTSRTGALAADLAARLEVAPAVALKVSAGASASEAIVQPTARLAPGTSYRFRIRTEAGTTAASWAFRTKQPLHVVTTIPRDQATSVPTRTGIEATFDQDDVVGYTGKVSISPAVPFELELAGRTLAIVPGRELAERTVYTVTIARGIGVKGSDVKLEKDAVIRFETGAHDTSSESQVGLDGSFAEVSPSEAPVLALRPPCRQDGGILDQSLVVYRLPSFDAALAAARTLLAAPSWATWSDSGLVPTSGLPVVLRLTAHVDTSCRAWGSDFVAFPKPLSAGAYLVVLPLPGRDAQLLLQVTRLALYTSVSETKTVAWVNDVVTGAPVAGATVSIGASALGRTDSQGLLLATTPRSLANADGTASPPVAVVRSGAAATLAPLGQSGFFCWRCGPGQTSDAYWLAFQTDRRTYRTTDTVHAWGVIRPRAGGTAKGVEVRLLAATATPAIDAPPLARASATPDRTGLFTASLPLADLPYGQYSIALVADGQVVAEPSIEVGEIRKPAYEIHVTLDRHVLVDGETFTATARATYYDGTPVPGLELAFEYGPKTTATTDASGTAKVRLTGRNLQDNGGPDYSAVSVTPVRPEEGAISGQDELRVYHAAVWPTVSATVKDGTLTIDGLLQALDIAGLERGRGGTEQVPEGGAPVAGRGVVIDVVQQIEHQRQTGTGYDWIAKRTYPIYEGWTENKSVARLTRTTGADGKTSASVALPDPRGRYTVTLSAKDTAGRTGKADDWVDAGMPEQAPWPSLASDEPSGACCRTYAVGERISLHVAEAVGAQVPDADRYLFTVAQRGIRAAVVGSTGAFERSFVAADLPSLVVAAVEFTGRAYVAIEPTTVAVREETQAIKIDLRTDAASYGPGSQATIGIRTTGPDGKPTSASVVVQAIDEKLYAGGYADDVDLLSELYHSLPDGVIWRASTHAPASRGDTTGGGDTAGGGGGARSDFRDILLFRRVTTDANGRGSVAFKVSDDLTSWRVTVGAVDARLHVGTATIQVPVGLPFFVEATVAPEYLVSDRPVLRLRAYGSSLKSGQAVSFTVSAPTLGLAATTVTGTAFKASRLELPRLAAGVHRIQVAGKTLSGSRLADTLVRTVRVVASRYQELTTMSAPLDAAFRPAGGDGLTTYVISDAGRATLAAILERMIWDDGARMDQALGAAVARDLLVDEFGRDAATLPETSFESGAYSAADGVALLPYGSADLTLTTGVALGAPDRFGRSFLENVLQASFGDPYSTQTRERGLVALAGLAAIGAPVGGELALFARQAALTARERLYLAIAYAELGDDAAARSIERSLLATYGRTMGAWVRLDVSPSPDEVVEATGLLAILAAALGDRVADSAQAYVEANPPRRTLLTLEELAFVRHSLDRLAPEAARFAWTLDGTRHVVDLGATGSFTLALMPRQRAALRLEPLAGQMTVTSSWLTAARPGARPADPDVRISRTVLPGTSVDEDQMVHVRLDVTFGAKSVDACYEITERVPSGLAPLPRPEGTAGASGRKDVIVVWPSAIAGQLVSFCAPGGAWKVEAAYSARVVSPGTYTWEPATIAASAGGNRVSLTEATTLTIR